jgi:TolB-like protein
MSSDREQEYFSDGITEEILNALAQVEGLRVIGRTSSFAMKGRNEDLRSVGQQLNATTLLEGSVRKAGSRVRITAQLIETAGGSHLWSQQYDRELDDVFAVQGDIAQSVVAALRLKLLPRATASARSTDAAAHDLYLRGLALYSRASGESAELAVQALQRAVDRDPGFAPAWAALARARFTWADYGTAEPTVEWPRALAAAEKAVSLAPDRSEGWLARSFLRMNALQDWPGATADIERARALNPDGADSRRPSRCSSRRSRSIRSPPRRTRRSPSRS